MSELGHFLNNPALADQVRLQPGAFTRQRCLTLPRIAALMIGAMCASVQAELDGLFAPLHDHRVRRRAVCAQAFSQARRGFSAEVFEHANAHLLAQAQPLIDAHRWHGRRVIAADASRLQVSTRAGADLLPDHYAFALFLPGAELTLQARLQPADGCERQMLFEALDALVPGHDLLVLDRGYPANWLAAVLVQRGIDLCVRVDATGWNVVKHFLRSGQTEAIVTLAAANARDASDYAIKPMPTQVRLIRDVTPAGSVRVLMTSLLDLQRDRATDFGALYHRRWRVEEAFKRIQHRLRLEAATGLTYLAFQQDFAAKIMADNLHILLAASRDQSALDPEPASRPNRTDALGTLKPILAGCLLALRHCLDALDNALWVIVRTRCRRQPGRLYPRPKRGKLHVYRAYRTQC